MKARLTLLALLLAAACHHETSAPAAAIKAADPCALLSADDVHSATGTAVREGETGGDETTRRCTWQESGEGAGSIIIAIHVVNMDNLMGELRNFPGSEKLPELGNEAFWNNALNQLTMRTNGGVVTINFSSSGGATDHKAAAVAISKILQAKL